MVAQSHQFGSDNGTVARMNATVQDLLTLPDDDFRYELIGGVSFVCRRRNTDMA